MDKIVSIVMPAYKAEATIAAAVASIMAQTWPYWRLIIVSDDGTNYRPLLEEAGLLNPRIAFMESGALKAGASHARNVALETIDTRYAAVLDADDRYKPQKLERAMAALADHPIVTTALDVMNDRFEHGRYVGAGEDRVLSPGEHKWVNLSMDTMIVWDRARCDARYDPDLPNMTDLDFLLKLWRTADHCYHIGSPLHDYVKMPVSMSNGPGVAERMIAVKTRLLDRFASGYYPLADENGREGLQAFLSVSLEAEKHYEAALAARPGLLFEDHLEAML
ncbi:glycosyltransferase family 2 protein [Devosia nitrariae]|nr:glycosyltransferase family A protein [Devosia nitrariae]